MLCPMLLSQHVHSQTPNWTGETRALPVSKKLTGRYFSSHTWGAVAERGVPVGHTSYAGAHAQPTLVIPPCQLRHAPFSVSLACRLDRPFPLSDLTK